MVYSIEKIRELIEKQGISTYEIADRIGYAQSTIYRWVYKESKMPVEAYIKIVEFLDEKIGIPNVLHEDVTIYESKKDSKSDLTDILIKQTEYLGVLMKQNAKLQEELINLSDKVVEYLKARSCADG